MTGKVLQFPRKPLLPGLPKALAKLEPKYEIVRVTPNLYENISRLRKLWGIRLGFGRDESR